jgi:dolichyl-diphosphooligosaccharide--protein glycosyltransferase
MLLLTIAAVRGSAAAAVGAGILAGSARLFTTTGFVLPAVLALGWATASAASADRVGLTRRAALSGASCVMVLVLGVITLGRPASLEYESLSLFHPLSALALFGLALATCAYFDGRRREAAAFAALGLAVLPLVPQLLRAAGQLARKDPLLAVVRESAPLYAAPGLALLLFGPVLVALPFALVGGVRALRTRTVPEAAAPLVATAIFVIGATAQSRFGLFLVGASAVMVPFGLGELISSLRPTRARWAYGVAALGFTPLLVMLVPPPPPSQPTQAALIRPTLLWMRDHLPPATTNPLDDHARPTYGVLAPFEYGHYVTLYAERPVLASPFSQTEAHVEANRLASEILSDTDEESAFRRSRQLHLTYVLAAPSRLFGGAPPPPDAMLSRLLRREPLGRFQPFYVSTELRAGGGRYATLYEVVDGAVITGTAEPGDSVSADLGDGYIRDATADAAGLFRIRVARPGVYGVSAGALRRSVEVTNDQIRAGSEMPIDAAR